jgi:hypothetical protein
MTYETKTDIQVLIVIEGQLKFFRSLFTGCLKSVKPFMYDYYGANCDNDSGCPKWIITATKGDIKAIREWVCATNEKAGRLCYEIYE